MKIKTLLNHKSKWTKLTYARTKDGIGVESTHPEATCWCLLGAAHHCYPINRHIVYEKLLKAIHKVFPRRRCSIATFNDNGRTKFEDIKKVLKEADV